MSCFCKHNWSKWATYDVEGRLFLGLNDMGPSVEVRQSKTCLKCGIIKERVII